MIDMPTLAFAMCGSFCTFEKALAQLALLQKDWDILPVMSETAYTTDTRFGTAESFHERIENICGRKIIHTIAEAEPIGPKRLADAVLVAPCTGNTAAKIANAGRLSVRHSQSSQRCFPCTARRARHQQDALRADGLRFSAMVWIIYRPQMLICARGFPPCRRVGRVRRFAHHGQNIPIFLQQAKLSFSNVNEPHMAKDGVGMSITTRQNIGPPL